MKKYLNTSDFIAYFLDKTNVLLNRKDIIDLVIRGRLTPCFWYSGMLTWDDKEYSKFRVDTGFRGYLTSYTLQDHYCEFLKNGSLVIDSRVFIYETLRTVGIPDKFIGDKYKSFYLLDRNHYFSVMEENRVPALSIIKKHREYVENEFIVNYPHELIPDDLDEIIKDKEKFLNSLRDFKVIDPDMDFDSYKEASATFRLEVKTDDISFAMTEIELIIEGTKEQQPEQQPAPKNAPNKEAKLDPRREKSLLKMMAIYAHMAKADTDQPHKQAEVLAEYAAANGLEAPSETTIVRTIEKINIILKQ